MGAGIGAKAALEPMVLMSGTVPLDVQTAEGRKHSQSPDRPRCQTCRRRSPTGP